MGDIVFIEVFDSEVVNYKGETDGPPIVSPESWGELALTVSCDNQPFFEEFLCNDSCLGEPVHAASSNFAEHVPVVVDLLQEIEFFNDVLEEEGNIHSEVFVALHGCHQIEIFNIDGHKFGVFGEDYVVEE